ncbi:MarR family winged helix-turn-helix transcriptional regulator [Streptomyces sp. NPDC048639]|uniref:MarR family winged helix-turn-helix transcriptional regulator n=1 Tax=Streptomyces sp. NPDC048639 TaxID=3365581 RepID=UPI0037217AB9
MPDEKPDEKPEAMALLVADIFEAAGALRRVGESLAQAEGLTQARWQALSVASEEPVTVPRAARRLGVSRQNVQRVANDLVALGKAEYTANPDHRGSPLLTLTPAGRATLGRITARASALHRTVATDLPDEAIDEARSFIRRLVAELGAYEARNR